MRINIQGRSVLTQVWIVLSFFVLACCKEKEKGESGDTTAAAHHPNNSLPNQKHGGGTRPSKDAPQLPAARQMDPRVRQFIDQLIANPTEVQQQLSEIGPGKNRADLIANLLYEASMTESLDKSFYLSLLSVLDASTYPEDGNALSGPKMERIVGKIGADGVAALLSEFSSKSLKDALTNCIGKEYARQALIPSSSQFRDLTPHDRIGIYSSVGENYKAESAAQLYQYLTRFDQNSPEFEALAIGAINANRNLEPLEIIQISQKAADLKLKTKLFRSGFNAFLSNDSISASKYLLENKSTLDPDVYQIGVREMINHLDMSSDKESSEGWKKELTGP